MSPAHQRGVQQVGLPSHDLKRCLFQSFATATNHSPKQAEQAFKEAGHGLKGIDYNGYPAVGAKLGAKLKPTTPPKDNLKDNIDALKNDVGDRYLLLMKHVISTPKAWIGHMVGINGNLVNDTMAGRANRAKVDKMWKVMPKGGRHAV